MSDTVTLDGEWVSGLEKTVADTKWEDWRSRLPTIFKAPKHIREIDTRAYEPVILALGPYHRAKPDLQAMNQLKWHYLKKFLLRNTVKSLVDYLKQVKALESQARMAYAEELNMSSNDFLQMLLLDACFVVETITFWEQIVQGLEAVQNPIESTSWAPRAVARDMLLLENQLPFFLLRTLFDAAFPYQSGNLPVLVLNFIGRFVRTGNMDIASLSGSPHHLLHIFHSCIIPETERGRNPVVVTGQASSEVPWMPNATLLKEVGVQFKMRVAAKSFLDVTFQNGVMEMTQLIIDRDTSTLFSNLTAFEQCHKGANPVVTAYVLLMKSIIDTAADVQLLKRDKIVIGAWGHSKEVANLFHDLVTDKVFDSSWRPPSIFSDVTKYYDSNRHRATHFNTRRAFISLFSVTLVLTLFTIVSYFWPPK
ncbi:UPF0481 protein [Musa troglodytarum]|uniref:UPF0481 protein n=1 Tax=Musa troglodytarum TaxID=320322 RepID=A0A9E7FNU7_9LILI|nr:UPF0481 protein [Musa troglodytarum]URD99279.1 UPF0481 protein [Musa troglodytarum]URD99280.1 UPF0481 protein [Musa troglodytarum]